MTLLVSVFAAAICTIVWYLSERRSELKLGVLSLMFWGSSLMWFVDAIFEYAELHEEYFTPAIEDMINDTYLGLSVVALGLCIWLVILFVKDPRGVVSKALSRKA